MKTRERCALMYIKLYEMHGIPYNCWRMKLYSKW